VNIVRPRYVIVGALILGSMACGGSTPTQPPPVAVQTPPPTPTAAATAISTAPPAGALACPYGKGTLDAQCTRSRSFYLADVEHAIGALAKRRPDIFNTAESPGAGIYRVVKVGDYFAEVAQHLQSAGFCVQADGFQAIQLKKGNEFSEKYAILTSDNFVRMGDGSYRDSCRPAIFPVDDVDHIDAVRVHFYGIQCPDGITVPDNAEKRLPVGCTGYVSATPKDKSNKDVPSQIHGPDIQWETLQGDGEHLVKVSDFPGQPFNKLVDAVEEGYFTMCATVKGIRGCFGFHTFR
jgi:hypothetical protein